MLTCALHFVLTSSRAFHRPKIHTMIAESEMKYATAGFSAYDEGCHDDVNKHVWLAVFWGCDDAGGSADGVHVPPSASTCVLGERDGLVAEWLHEYARFHVSPALADDVTDLIFALEENWVGPVVGNPTINATHDLFNAIQDAMCVHGQCLCCSTFMVI